MTEFAIPEAEATYFMRRLSMTRRVDLPASIRFDLARLPISDDELEDALGAFGVERSSGWGFSSLLEDALSKEPASIGVDDLSALQQNLIAHGYAPPDAEPNGAWDPSWYGALRRADSDAYREVMSGHHPLASPIEAGVRMISNTLPSRVWQGMVGAAKGFVVQAPETAERVGLVGGAAAGAGIGAAIGSVVPGAGTAAGAGVGAVVGAGVGLLADLFGSDEGEQDQSNLDRIVDALTPFEEYTGPEGAKKFLEDLGWVASAASMIAGAGIAVKGVGAGIGLARGVAGETGSSFGAAFMARGGPVEPGWFTKIAAAATRPALGPARVETMVNWVKLNGLRAQAGRPIFQTIQGGYTGMSAGQLGARTVSGLGTGTAEIDAEIAGLQGRLAAGDVSSVEISAIESELSDLEARKAESMTTIQRTIEETKPLNPYVDLLGFLIYPTRFFPVRLREVGNTARSVLGNVDMAPIANIIQREESIPLHQAVARGRELLGRDSLEQAVTNTWLRRNFGIDMLAAEKVADLGMGGAELAAEGAFNKARASVISALHKDVAENPIPDIVGTKVVDATGRPLRVFHGTDRVFNEFDPARISPLHDPGPGLYFTESGQAASEYALGYRTMEHAVEGLQAATEAEARILAEEAAGRLGPAYRVGQVVEEEAGSGVWTALLASPEAMPNVRTVYLDIRKPFDWDAPVSGAAMTRIEGALKSVRPGASLSVGAGAKGEGIFEAVAREVGREGASKVLSKAGFDGVTQLDVTLKGSQSHRVWVAFEPSQIHPAFEGPFIGENLVGESLAEHVLRWSVDDPARFEAWLVNKKIGSLPQYIEAERLASRVTQDIREGVTPLQEWQVRGKVVGDAVAEFERLKQTTKMENLLAQADKLEREAARTTEIGLGVQLHADAKALRVEAESLKLNLPKVLKVERTTDNMVIVPERLDTLTSGELHSLADEFLRLRLQVTSNAKAGPGSAAWAAARRDLSEWADDLARRYPVPQDILEAAKMEKPSGKLADYLQQRASTAAGEIQLSEPVMREFEALGYKPVVTSGDVLLTKDMLGMGELMGVGDYTRRAAFFETLGFGVREFPDDSLFKLVEAHQVSELGQIMVEARIPMTGAQARAHLYRRLGEIGRRGVAKGPLRISGERGKLIELPKVDIRDLAVDDILSAFERVSGFTDETAHAVYGALKRGAAFGAEVKVAAPMDTMRGLGRALRLNGLSGFSDFMRTAQIHDPTKLVPLSAAAGAGLGLVSGDDKLEDALKGAIGGAVVGLGARAFTKGAYGYLPDRLVRLNTALRYSLSFTFDAGRYTESATTMMAKYDLPGIIRPRQYISRRGALKTPYEIGTVSGDDAWAAAVRFRDDLTGGSLFKNIDDLDRRATQVGLLGFTPRDHEAAYALLLYQRGWGKKQILEAISQVNRYGMGRTAAEKSANFIFFPFSFSKKYLTTLGDWFLQAPARALLLHEGLKRYHESSLDERLHDLVEERLPLLKQLAQVNNLVYGISPGRFFLKGLDDNRTNVGKVSQILASIFVPSGAATPLAQAAGGLGDFTINAFVPVVVTGESIDRAGGIDGLDDIVRRYVPLIREIDQYFVQGEGTFVGGAVGSQITAITEGKAPYAQYQDYLDQLREDKNRWEPMALALGYSSADGLLNSNIGLPLKMRHEDFRLELAKKYPTGAAMSQEFESTALIHSRAIADLAEKANRSEGEDAIVHIAEEQFKWRMLATLTSISPEIINAISAQKIRQYALRYADDRRFRELYEYLFAQTYGPISRVA